MDVLTSLNDGKVIKNTVIEKDSEKKKRDERIREDKIISKEERKRNHFENTNEKGRFDNKNHLNKRQRK